MPRFSPPLIPRDSAPSLYPAILHFEVLATSSYSYFFLQHVALFLRAQERLPGTTINTPYVERDTRSRFQHFVLQERPYRPPPPPAFEKSSSKAPCGATWNSLRHRASSVINTVGINPRSKCWYLLLVFSTRLQTQLPYDVEYVATIAAAPIQMLGHLSPPASSDVTLPSTEAGGWKEGRHLYGIN